MKEEAKHGNYDKFDWSKASWICPNCKQDKLGLAQIYEKYFVFKCNNCGLDSKDYAVVMKSNSTFNDVHRGFTREWVWIDYLTRKYYTLGAKAVVKLLEDAEAEAAMQ